MSKKLLLTLLLVVLASGVIFFVQHRRSAQVTPQPEPVVSNPEPNDQSSQTDTIDTSDWKTYRNDTYGFEVKYPKNWSVAKTTTPTIFYFRSTGFIPVLTGYTHQNQPILTDGEFMMSVVENKDNIPIKKRYLRFDDASRLYFVDETEGAKPMPRKESIVNGRELYEFETHQGFGLNTGEFTTTKILGIKNSILQFDYISQTEPDPQIERILESVVRSVSDL